MCRPASFIVAPGYVYWSKFTDSHQSIREEFDLRGENLLKVEVIPPDSDVFSDPERWVFRVDQDIVPPWVEEQGIMAIEARVRRALRDWHASKVHVLSDEFRHVYIGSVWIKGTGALHLHDAAEAVVYGDVQVRAFNGGRVHAYDRTIVHAYGRSQVWAHDAADVQLQDRASCCVLSPDVAVYARNESHVSVFYPATVRAEDFTYVSLQLGVEKPKRLTLRDCAVALDTAVARVYHAKGATAVVIEEGEQACVNQPVS